MYRTAFFLIIAAGFFTGPAVAQQAVHVGKGSYAEFPPPSAGNAAAEMVRRTFPLVDRTDRPIPTNKLWTALLEGKAAGSLWMYPCASILAIQGWSCICPCNGTVRAAIRFATLR